MCVCLTYASPQWKYIAATTLHRLLNNQIPAKKQIYIYDDEFLKTITTSTQNNSESKEKNTYQWTDL